MSAATVDRDTLRAARDDLRAFGDAVGVPLTGWQADGLALERPTTVLVAPRQTGKSRGLALLAVHRSLRVRNHRTLIVSAGEEGAKRLLGMVRAMLTHPLLLGTVLDETAGTVTFANGSEIRAVPASERQVRGWTVDLLLLDEASFIGDDLIYGAALPTVAARPDARVVFASTPWEASGAFYAFATMDHPDVAVFRWALRDASWISPAFIAQMRATMPALRFRAEFDAEFVDGGSGLFSRTDLLDAVAPYPLVMPELADGGTVLLGCDWGRARDSHALAMIGCLDDGGLNRDPVLYVPWLEVSQRSYADQVDRIFRLAGIGPQSLSRAWLPGPTQGRRIRPMHGAYDVARVFTEANGVGAGPSEALEHRLGVQVEPVMTTQRTKELAFSRLQGFLSARQLVLPEHPQLLRELSALEVTPTENGGVRIAGEGGHPGDLAMALSLAALGLDDDLTVGPTTPRRPGPWPGTTTPSGLFVPENPRPRTGGMGRARFTPRGA